MAKADQINWTTQDRIRSHEAYLRGSRSLAATLNWAVGESATPTPDKIEPDVLTPDVEFPSTLTDNPQDHDDAVDHSDGTEAHDTSASVFATNWDALLDTAGVPTDGTPPDPLAAQQQQQQLEEQAAQQSQMTGKDTNSPPPGFSAPPAPPAAQQKAKEKERAGRGVEGCGDDVDPANPMGPGNKFDMNMLSLTPRV